MEDQVGWRGMEARLKREAMQWTYLLPQLPRLMHTALTRHRDADRLIDEVRMLRREQQRDEQLVRRGDVSVAGGGCAGGMGSVARLMPLRARASTY